MNSLSRLLAVSASVFLSSALTALAVTVTATADPVDGGIVTGGGTYAVGDKVSVKAKANKNWALVEWNDPAHTVEKKIKFVASNDVSYVATFTPITGFLTWSTSSLNLGSVPVTLSASQAVTFANSGPGVITVKKITLPSGFAAVPKKFTVPAGGTTKIYITFTSKTAGTFSGAATVSSDAARTTGSLSVSATAAAQSRVIRLVGDMAFGSVQSGDTVTRPLYVCNDGNSPMSITAVTWSNNTGTALSATPTAFTVAAGGTSTVNVSFAPKTSGVWNAALVFTVTSLTSGSRGIAVTGTGTVTPSGTRIIRLVGDLDFGEQLVEQVSTRALTVYNDGTAAMTVSSVTWTNNPDNSFSNSPASLTVPAGGSAVMNVIFKPKNAKRYDNAGLRLNVTSLDSGSNTALASGGASAWGNGTWTASLAVSGATLPVTLSGNAYVWQENTNILAEIVATIPALYGGGSIDGVFVGTVQDRTNIPGFLSNSGAAATPLTLFYSAGNPGANTQTDPTIVSGVIPYGTYTIKATFHPRTSTNTPALHKPVFLTVVSEHGSGFPRPGYYGSPYGKVLTNSMTAVSTVGGTRYTTTGWTMTGNAPASGVGSTMVMTHTNEAVLTWLWATNYALTASVDTNSGFTGGSISGDTNGWYAPGATVSITANADPGYHFVSWSGDTAGDPANATQNLTMDQAKTLVATFAADPPPAIAEPKAAAAPATVSAIADPSLILTVLATADGTALASAMDGRCALLTVREGAAAIVFPDDLAPVGGAPVVTLEVLGADADADGLPDNVDKVLGSLLQEGAELLVLRQTDGWLQLETPFLDRLRIEGPAVPVDQLPAVWQITTLK
jgi:hypothetical protein